VKQIVNRHRGEPTYRPIVIVDDASLAQVAAVSARKLDFELPDVRVEEVPTRKYPETMGAHLFGYVGEATDQQVSQTSGLKSGDIIGQSGIEKVYNADLKGEDGAKVVVVNSLGREIRTLDEQRPTEASACSSRSTTTCSGRSRTGSTRSASTARRWCSIRETGACLGSPAVRRTTRTRSRPASIGRPGRR
jgi:hypothetical protein